MLFVRAVAVAVPATTEVPRLMEVLVVLEAAVEEAALIVLELKALQILAVAVAVAVHHLEVHLRVIEEAQELLLSDTTQM
jgi:hypothetical protein